MDGCAAPAIRSAMTAARRRSRKTRVGLVGAGAAGARHAAALAKTGGLVGTFDSRPDRAHALAGASGAAAFPDLDALIEACDAIVVAAPATTHAQLAERALDAGRHVLVEKPLAATIADAERLVNLAHRRGVVLQTGHHERVWIEALGLFDGVEPPIAIRAEHAAPASLGIDVSVTLDLMIQDLDIVASLFGASPLEMVAHGVAKPGRPADRMEARVAFAGGDAEFLADRTGAPARRRLELIFADDATCVIDLLNGRVEGPARDRLRLDALAACPDPLTASLASFLRATAGAGASSAPGAAGAAAVRLAAAIDGAATILPFADLSR